ncbi:hypothetical protein [Actinoplanes sp. NPDC051411]|uniref:hypothetical protein n=1 Tax=Actinoplanes sp. NPDC051411 TaxID=3155522 RepID=UPI003446EF12
MDVLPRTFTGTHMNLLSRCIEPTDKPVLVGRWAQGFLLLTRRRLVITRRSNLLHRMRLHLNTNVRHLRDVNVTVEDRGRALVVNLTAVDGIRERFQLRMNDEERARRAEELFRSVLDEQTKSFAIVA